MLSKIDELLLPEYSYLDGSDECYFLREYTAGRGYAFSETNNLISNFKKPPSRAGTSQGFYKDQALEQLAAELRGSLGEGWLKTATLVPIPPSKAIDHPDHDDRLARLLAKLAPGPLDIRLLLRQEKTTDAAHLSPHRPRPEAIAANYRVNLALLTPKPAALAIVDDVLTTGAHFKAARQVLRPHFPGIPMIGIFLARTVRLAQAGDAPQLP